MPSRPTRSPAASHSPSSNRVDGRGRHHRDSPTAQIERNVTFQLSGLLMAQGIGGRWSRAWGWRGAQGCVGVAREAGAEGGGESHGGEVGSGILRLRRCPFVLRKLLSPGG